MTADTRPHSNLIVAHAQAIGRQFGPKAWQAALVCEWAAIWAHQRKALAKAVRDDAPDGVIASLREHLHHNEEELSRMILGEPDSDHG